MSRIGNTPIIIPEEVTVTINGNLITIKGPKGELTHTSPSVIKIAESEKQLTFTPQKNDRPSKALHGLTRSLVFNMIQGVTKGFQKQLELVGTGYRVAKTGSKLTLNLGLSHPVEVDTPEGLSLEVEGNNKIIVSGIDKQKVGQLAAEIRNRRPPEVYKGKGIRYQDEVVHRKPGKAAKVGAAGE